MKKNNFIAKLFKGLKIFLIITLCLGILSTSFGVVVTALGMKKSEGNGEDPSNPDGTPAGDTATNATATYEYPTKNFSHLKNEVTVKDGVVTLSDTQSNAINSSIVAVEEYSSYNGNRYTIRMQNQDPTFLDGIYNGSIIQLKGNENTAFGGNRFFKVERVSNNNGEAALEVTEPDFNEVFENLEVCSTNTLTEENFVGAYYMDGVTSHFGNIDEEFENVSQTQTLSSSDNQSLEYSTNAPEVGFMANEYSTQGKDLIVNFGVDLGKQDQDTEENNAPIYVDGSCKLSGEIGIRDLAAHLVIDMPSATNLQEFYVGLSGQMFAGINFNGKLGADAQPEATKKEWKFLTLEGLNDKRFPLAVFQFKGSTPVYISSKTYESAREAIYPTIFMVVYSDWEGSVSLELDARFEYAHSFNNGLTLCHEGEKCIRLESYPYTKAYDVEDEDGVNWKASLSVSAETDITLAGCSVLFYIAGVNIAEVSAARLGVETKGSTTIEANSEDKIKEVDSDSVEFYARLYLKMLEFKVKITAQGEKWLDRVSLDVDFQFALLDLTLYKKGHMPDKYKLSVPVSKRIAPTDFTSVISIVFDVSSSMNSSVDTGETKLQAAQSASKIILSTAEKWAEKYPQDQNGIGVVQFNNSARTVTIPHIDYDYISACIDGLGSGGGTDIAAGLDTGISQLDAVTSTNKIIILMTDGRDNNSNSIMASAEKAKEKGMKVYTIGFGNDVDANLLQEIATLTGGEYSFADTGSIMGIVGSFMYAQQASTSKVITSVEGAVSQGETTEPEGFTVEEGSGDLCVTTAWPGSILDTILIDPSGRAVDENYPGAVIDDKSIPTVVTVENPVPGKWSFSIKGVETSYDKEPYYTIVSFKELDNVAVNEPMTKTESAASYCIPIGVYTTLVSIMLLVGVAKLKKEDEGTPED